MKHVVIDYTKYHSVWEKIIDAEAAFVDIDGTLVNSEPIIRDVIEELAKEAGYNFKEKDWDSLAGIGDREVGKQIATWCPEFADKYPTGEDFEIARLKRYEERIGEVKANQPALDLVNLFIKAGKPVVAVTNSPIHLAKKHLKIAGYPADKMGLISQEDAYDRSLEPKPNPALYELAFYKTALDRLDSGVQGGFKRKKCLILEDSGTGVRAGLRAGMMTIQFTDMCKVLDSEEAAQISSRKASFYPMKFEDLANMMSQANVPA
ncbi:MAG: HAD family phosphatase [Pseudomonadota bacterium]